MPAMLLNRSAGGSPAGPPALRLVVALFLGGCATASMPMPNAWETVPTATAIGDYCAHFQCAANPRLANIRVSENRLFNGSKPLTPQFAALDSYDLSLDRKEIVFSAKRKDSFDVGLVSMDGSDIHWIPEDPADEVNVQWAPRGNKVSYILHTATGSIVRTVHVPTATQLSIDFPDTQIDALAWEPQAERFAVVIESPDASQRLVSMTYEGKKREDLITPQARLDVSIEPVGGVLVMRPSALHYNERLPLVVWTENSPFAWNDARAALMKNVRVAIAIAPKFSDNFWTEAKNVAWINSSRTYEIVGNPATGQPGNPATQQPSNAATIIQADNTVPAHRYIRHGNTLSVPPAVVQSFAAAFIADDLKGTPPPNGRR
jgi:hypothetical protein